MSNEALIQILLESKRYINIASTDAESKHDDIDGDLYMDLNQYEIFTEGRELMGNIDKEVEKLKGKK